MRRLAVLLCACGFSPTSNGASQCPMSRLDGYAWCDGFEDGLDGRYLQTNAVLDGGKAYRGSSSLHFRDPGALMAAFVPADPAEMNLRVFLWADAAPDVGRVLLATLGDLDLFLDKDGLVLGNLARFPGAVLRRWLCVELQLASSGGPWVGTLTVDGGTPVTMATTVGNSADSFGLQSDATFPLDVWFDELVVDHRSIGCDR